MSDSTPAALPLTLGLDLGARKSQVCAIAPDGQRFEERSIPTTRAGIESLLGRFEGARVVLDRIVGQGSRPRGRRGQPAEDPDRDR